MHWDSAIHLLIKARRMKIESVSPEDKCILRDLARQVADIAALPVQAERRKDWVRHNKLESKKPMILVFPEGSWEELLTDDDLICEGKQARSIEWQLRNRMYYHEHFQDDTVIEKEWIVNKVIHNSGWGLEAKQIPSPERRGAWIFDPVIHKPGDLKKLRFPEITYDEAETQSRLNSDAGFVWRYPDGAVKGCCPYFLPFDAAVYLFAGFGTDHDGYGAQSELAP